LHVLFTNNISNLANQLQELNMVLRNRIAACSIKPISREATSGVHEY